MSTLTVHADRLLDLAEAVCDKIASQTDLGELDSVLLADDASRRRYLGYCRMHVALKLDMLAHDAVERVCKQIGAEPVATALSQADVARAETPFVIPVGFLSTTFQSTIGFSSGWPVAYSIATVITGLWILGFWLMPVSRPEQVATHSVPPAAQRQLAPEPLPSSVGRITGVVDCNFAHENMTPVSADVRLGRKYELASGLMEITYNTGAKVILQGPVTYSVEANGGYLAVGKLTGKLEKSGEWRVESGELAANQKSEIRNQESSLSTIHYPLFTIRTPTATVTDLGTEFGVEVRDQGVASVVVFDGAVNITENQRQISRVATVGETVQIRNSEIVRVTSAQATTPFVRTIASSSANRAARRDFFSYDFEPPSLKAGRLLGQDGWKGIQFRQDDQNAMLSLAVGSGTGANSTQVAGAAGFGGCHYHRFKWCRQWLQIPGVGATVTEEFWAYAATPANTDVVMGAMWAPESSPALGVFGMSKGKWYVRRVGEQGGAQGTEYTGQSGIKASHWYHVKLVIDFSVPGGSATLYHRDVTAGETTFTRDQILHGVEMQIPMVPWGPPAGQYEISGICLRPEAYSNNTGQLYLDNFSVRIERNGENTRSEQKGAEPMN